MSAQQIISDTVDAATSLWPPAALSIYELGVVDGQTRYSRILQLTSAEQNEYLRGFLVGLESERRRGQS